MFRLCLWGRGGGGPCPLAPPPCQQCMAPVARAGARASVYAGLSDAQPAMEDERFSTAHIRDWDGVSADSTSGFRGWRRRWRSLAMALGLGVFGFTMLLMGALRMLGYVPTLKEGQATGMLVLGSLTSIPGGYYSYVAYRAFRGDPSYSLAHIPLSFE